VFTALGAIAAGTPTPYPTIKSVVRADKTPDEYVREASYHDNKFVLFTCDIAPSSVPEWSFDPDAAAKLVLASRAISYERALISVRYSNASATALVGRYEHDGLAAIAADPAAIFSGKLEKTMNAEAEKYRTGDPAPPEIDFGNRECGGSPALAKATFVLKPAGVRAFIIPAFFAKLCKAKGIDSLDLGACEGWVEILDGASLSVRGNYLYQLVPKHGPGKHGTLMLDTTQTVRLTA